MKFYHFPYPNTNCTAVTNYEIENELKREKKTKCMNHFFFEICNKRVELYLISILIRGIKKKSAKISIDSQLTLNFVNRYESVTQYKASSNAFISQFSNRKWKSNWKWNEEEITTTTTKKHFSFLALSVSCSPKRNEEKKK